MTPDEIEHIKSALGRIEGKLDRQNGRLRVLEEWKARAEGFAAGSRWTLTALSLTIGIIGGGGVVVILRGL